MQAPFYGSDPALILPNVCKTVFIVYMPVKVLKQIKRSITNTAPPKNNTKTGSNNKNQLKLLWKHLTRLWLQLGEDKFMEDFK